MKRKEIPAGCMRASDVCAEAGLTYRQVDHWVRRGFIFPAGIKAPGTGSLRAFDAYEVQVIKTAAPLVAAGMNPERALPFARALVAGVPVRIGDVVMRREVTADAA